MAKKTTKAKARNTTAKKTTRKQPVKNAARKAVKTKANNAAAKRKPAAVAPDELFAPILGAERRYLGRVQLEVVRAGDARVKRMIYPPGFKWSVDMMPAVGTELCMHAHVGYLAHGEIHIEYADGCIVEFKAPAVVAIDPGHDGWVVGTEPVVLIEFDFERDTVARMGMPNTHRHE
jgi:hypothetical protein